MGGYTRIASKISRGAGGRKISNDKVCSGLKAFLSKRPTEIIRPLFFGIVWFLLMFRRPGKRLISKYAVWPVSVRQRTTVDGGSYLSVSILRAGKRTSSEPTANPKPTHNLPSTNQKNLQHPIEVFYTIESK